MREPGGATPVSTRVFRVIREPEIELLSERYLGRNGRTLGWLSELPERRISFLMQINNAFGCIYVFCGLYETQPHQ